MKALLVEDSKGMRKLMVSMLKTMGFDDVVEASHGGEAWEELRRRQFDLLLTDWNMPVMDGIELVEKVRKTAEMQELPILLFTARSAKEDVLRALRAGIDTYIAKPFSPQQLQAKVRSIMGRRSERHVQHILAGQDRLDRGIEDPLIIVGEGASSPHQLAVPSSREVVRYLAALLEAVSRINERSGTEMHVGYRLEASTSDITRRMRSLRGRIRLLLLSTDVAGGGVTLARLASINRQSALAVFVVCEMRNEIPTKARFGLEHLGITVLERHALSGESLEQLLNEYVVGPAREGVAMALPTPDEIRRRLETDIRTMVSLPVLPQVYHQIIALDKDPESDIEGWIEAIDVDPLSRAQVIRRARSPVYGFQGEIDETSKAVILLGKTTIREIIVAGSVRRSFEGIQEDGFDVEDYWMHSVAVALSARLLSFPLDRASWTPDQRRDFEQFEIEDETVEALRGADLANRLPLPPDADPFVAGMMHDIGKVALVQAYPGLFGLIIGRIRMDEWRLPMRAAEQEFAGGADHALVGRILADSWRLGEQLGRVVEFHHQPAADDRLSQLVALANFLAGGISPYPRDAAYPARALLSDAEEADAEGAMSAAAPFLPEGLLEQLELPMEQLVALGRRLAPTVKRLADGLRRSV